MLSDQGIHAFNHEEYITDIDPMAFYDKLRQIHDDPPHAFYMGMELARAQVAWQLGRSYKQDRMLEWGAAIAPGLLKQLRNREQELSGTTLNASKRNRKRKGRK